MKKIKVLTLADAKGYGQNYYSEQLEILLEDKHISETNYFLTDGNIIVDMEKDMDKKDINVKKSIKAGAIIKNMFLVNDSNFSEHIFCFNSKGLWNGIEYGEDHGIIFDKETDAKRYEKYINIMQIKGDILEKIEEIEDIEISFCKKIGKVVAPEFTHYLLDGDDDIREISESKTNKVYKRGKICPLGIGYLISCTEWQWVEQTNKENCDIFYIQSRIENDMLEKLCDYTIGMEDVGGFSECVIYIVEFK
jgi:hypothetical protein